MHYGGLHDDAVQGKAYDPRLISRFLRYVRPYRLLVALTVTVLPLVTLCRLAQPLLVRQAIDRAIIPGNSAALWQPALLLLGTLLLEAVLTWGEVFGLQYLGQRIMADLRRDLFSHLLHLPTRWFDRSPAGGVVTRVTTDVEAIGEMFAAGIVSIVGDILLLIGIMVAMLALAPALAVVTFSVVPFLAVAAWYFRRSMRTAYRTVRSCLGRMNAALSELIDNLVIVQSFRQEQAEQERFRSINQAHCDAGKPVIFWDATLYAFVEFFSSVAIALILWYGSSSLQSGVLTFGTLVAFIQYVEKFFGPVRDLSAKYGVMQGAMAALERMFGLLDESVEQDGGASAAQSVALRDESATLVRFEQVCFGYEPQNPIIQDISFAVTRGERVAIVGRSGAGKTTLLRLLTRMYDYTGGTIYLDGTALTELSRTEVRKKIVTVAQEADLMAGTIRQNISLGDPLAEKRVVAAATAIGAAGFIERLPGGYDTPVGVRGGTLSQGERQLISFARALAFDPELLLLDEATANVDSISEQVIQEGVRKLLEGRTALIVAHRLATIRDADRILVIDGGRLVESGTHEQLMTASGCYRRLYETSQRLGLQTIPDSSVLPTLGPA